MCGPHGDISQRKMFLTYDTYEVIEAYVTAEARIDVYCYLDSLQKRVLYCDTDSVIYIQPNAEPPLVETGDCLGAMTSEQKPALISKNS